MPKRSTGFREITHLLKEDKLIAKFPSDNSDVPNDLGGDGNIFDSTNTDEKTFTNSNNAFHLTYTFTDEGKRPINRIIINMSKHAETIQVQVSENGLFENVGGVGLVPPVVGQINDDLTSTFVQQGVSGTIVNDTGTTTTDNTDLIFTFDEYTLPDGDMNDFGVLNSSGTGPGEPKTIEEPKLYKAFRISFNVDFENATDARINYIQVFEEFAYHFPKTYNVEFNDSILELAGWKNARYEGSKLTAQSINRFNLGDKSYGKNPVITSRVACLYYGTTIIGGDSGLNTAEEEAYVRIIGHSYVSIDKLILINLDTDAVEIIDRQNTTEDVFKRFVDTNLEEGSIVNLKILDNAVNNSLKQKYTVKFNRGSLQKLYSYTANEDGFEDGVFGGHLIRSNNNNEFVDSLEGSGLFGFGMTAAASRSLFTTNSIDFVSVLPTELNQYEGDINLTTLGSELAPITSSVTAAPAPLVEENLASSDESAPK